MKNKEEKIKIGDVYDWLTVKEYFGKTNYGQKQWLCICKCGCFSMVNQRTLLRTDTFHSCGCYQKKFLTPGTSERCKKAAIESAKVRNIDGCFLKMLDNETNIITNTSGHKGLSWSKSAHKWHVYVGYKSYRCNLGFYDDKKYAIKIREKAVENIENGTFEDFFFEVRGFRIEEKLQKNIKQ